MKRWRSSPTISCLRATHSSWDELSIEGAKTAETRQRRIDKSVTMLGEGRAR
ncbi:MAG: YdeI/OmpD-associated family protein [Actinobacteria bacterium]|nr:YdeI/OmpD-associated family protein [Actinomycetota bacterium]